MIVRVLTDRPEQYAFLKDYYRDKTIILFTSKDDLTSAGQLVDEDIVIADPEVMINTIFAGTLMKRRNTLGKPFIISEPGRVKGLTRELKAAGLDAVKQNESDNTVYGTVETSSTETLLYQPRRPPFRYVVGIIELNEKADAGFLTMLLAEELASESLRDGSIVTVFAPDSNYFYYALSLGKKYGSHGFKPLDALLESNPPEDFDNRVLFNLNEGICWAVDSTNQWEEKDMDSDSWKKTLDRLEGNYILRFFGALRSERELEQVCDVVDALIVVADPLPSSMLSGRQCLEVLQRMELPLIYVVNHMTETVKKDLILDYLDTNRVFFIPSVDPEAVCESEYLEENPYRVDRIRKKTMAPVCGIIEQIRKVCSSD